MKFLEFLRQIMYPEGLLHLCTKGNVEPDEIITKDSEIIICDRRGNLDILSIYVDANNNIIIDVE